MVLRGRRINNFADFSLNACSAAMGIWVSSINFYINDTGCPPQPQVWRLPKLNLEFHDSTQKINVFKTPKKDDSSHCIIKFKLLSESDDLSGLIDYISHGDLNSLDDLDSLFDLKNASALDTEWFSWPQPPGQPLFVGLIIKNPIFLWYLAPSLLEAVEASLWHLYEI